MTNKFVKSVSFNLTNPHEAQMFAAIKRRNFSGYVKKLIAADIYAKGNAKTTKPAEELTQTSPIEVAQVAPTQSTTDKLAQLKRGGISAPKLF